MDEFYRRIKLKAQSQDTRKQADLFDEKYRFKSKDNKHWVCTKILHTIDTFKEATKKYFNKQLTKKTFIWQPN